MAASADDRVVRVAVVAEDRGRPGVPVVEVQDVDRRTVGPERLQRGPAEQPEAPGVVRVVARPRRRRSPSRSKAAGWSTRSEPVAVRATSMTVDGAAARRASAGQARGRVLDPPVGQGRVRHDAVARQEDVDRVPRPASPSSDRPRARASASTTSAEAARLGPWLAFGGEHRHAIGIAASYRQSVRRCRPGRRRTTNTSRAARRGSRSPGSSGYHAATMDPVRVPSIPAASFPAAAPARRTAAAGVQPPLGVASRGRAACSAWSIGRPGRATGTRSRSSAARPTGPVCSTTPSSSPNTTTSWPSSTGTWPTASDHWFQRRYADALDGPIAYFCAEYGFHESLGIYSGGLGVLRRRPHEVGQRHGPPGDRRRAAVSQGLLPPDDRRRRPPGARVPRLRPVAPAARARPGRRPGCR